jgi:hypothetical protein
MSNIIPETYTSPNLRLGFFTKDHPTAPQPEFHEAPGNTVGVPDSHQGEELHCICTLNYGPEEGRPPVIGWKIITGKKGSEEWETHCTKALGRALKRAGYPDDLEDLRARNGYARGLAEIEAIRNGVAPPKTVSRQGVTVPAEDTVKATSAVQGDMTERARAEVEWSKERQQREESVPTPEPEATPEAEKTEQPELTLVQGEGGAAEDVRDIEVIREQLKSLTDAEKQNFREWLAGKEITGKLDDWADEVLDQVEEWLTT